MSKKPVMGHNPMDYRPLADAKFSFIPQTESGSGITDPETEKKSSKKKVVSYYLEESLIEEIRNKAKERENSYSHYVGEILKKGIKE